jgi:hypothetical protein
MDCQNFINEVANEFLAYPNCYDDLSDLLNVTIDDYVGHNDIKTNEKIVMEIAGGVYEAIKLYEIHLGNPKYLHKGSKQQFYKELAFVSLFISIYPQVKSIVDVHSSSSLSEISDDGEFNLNDVNCDIDDMIYETISSYITYESTVAIS